MQFWWTNESIFVLISLQWIALLFIVLAGRIHTAVISGINLESNSVTVEWFEKNEIKGKEACISFYRAACNADAVLWWEFCPSVCLSVRPSVTRVYCDKTVEGSVQIYIPYERTFSLVFWEEEWLVRGDPYYLKFWVNWPALEKNRRFSTNNRSQRLSRNT